MYIVCTVQIQVYRTVQSAMHNGWYFLIFIDKTGLVLHFQTYVYFMFSTRKQSVYYCPLGHSYCARIYINIMYSYLLYCTRTVLYYFQPVRCLYCHHYDLLTISHVSFFYLFFSKLHTSADFISQRKRLSHGPPSLAWEQQLFAKYI